MSPKEVRVGRNLHHLHSLPVHVFGASSAAFSLWMRVFQREAVSSSLVTSTEIFREEDFSLKGVWPVAEKSCVHPIVRE